MSARVGDQVLLTMDDIVTGLRMANAMAASVYGPRGEQRKKWGEAAVNSTRPEDATSSSEDCIHAQYSRRVSK